PRATTSVPTSVIPAAAPSATAGCQSATQSATSIGPRTKTSSNSAVSAASAVTRTSGTSAVSAFQVPRTAAVRGGNVTPASTAAPSTTGSGRSRSPAKIRKTRQQGYATPVATRTGAGPIRSASRPTTGLATALAIA